ncbi:MAG TPA: glycoside hydrolase family 2 TIM barrel-domain containing protein [Chitinophaga sp.]|uniref:glycoside hydrolase family 2 TIM barrel-domain containing protein n=1 Tax=Chitinophaga sp. TaxID=1869181 RepID=UPI002DB8F82A|nr:glycoside hydrolase family 2 TIM barrel-domain containing protein [Chitinophaga sp.]HEU4552114.1 glycoside hydrolase family 2 TIM barrel-domain containing protein [Chitinophaga sp.]
MLYRNGRPFVVKGASGYTHLEVLRQMGGNTIRTWDTLNLAAILNEAQRNNLAVIVGLPMPGSSYLSYFYKDTAKVNAQYRALQQVVEQYKHHPALLMWCLGNELEFKASPAQRPFYKAFNNLLDMIHAADPDHPVTTTMTNFSVIQAMLMQWQLHHLDLISINAFGELQVLDSKLQHYARWWSGPFLVTEWGAYGPWEVQQTAWDAPIENTSTKKAEHYQQLYRQLPLKNPRCLGALVFYWGQKQETTPTWFSLFDEQGRRTEAVNVIQQLWTGQPAMGSAPAVRYMLLNKKGAADNIILTPRSLQTAELLMESPPRDSLVFQWQVMQEDWFSELGQNPRLLLDTVITGNTACLFRTPAKEGPYRIYVKVSDGHGQIATANTPFYIVK